MIKIIKYLYSMPPKKSKSASKVEPVDFVEEKPLK